jgi:diaminopimelate epimerase
MSDTLPLTKLHGLGNDFIVYVADGTHDAPADPAAFARRVCDRHRGVGADGLLTAVPGPAPDAWEMTLHNADGSLAEMSGNGIRCFAQAVIRHTGSSLPATLRVQTDGGPRTVSVDADPGGDPDVVTASVTMGAPRPGPSLEGITVPGRRPIGRMASWDVGNPHLVLEVADVADVDLEVEGPAWDALVPGGVNVHFITITGDNEVDQVTWERGAGVTLACGTGATATALSLHAWGAASSPVSVRMPGGTVRVELADEPTLYGPSEWIADLVVKP